MKCKFIKINLKEQTCNDLKNNEMLNEIIDEELHMFNSQYKLANEIANVVYVMMIKNIKKNIYPISNNEKINIVEINIDDYISVTNNVIANIDKINDDKKMIRINITLPPNSLILDKNKVIFDTSNVIAHELMHGNIFFNRMDNKQNINDAPYYYGNLIKILHLYDDNDIVYQFAYALYATYYHEMNTIVSQTSMSIYNLIKQNNIKHVDNETIKNLLIKTDSYQIYVTILDNIIPLIEKMDENKIYQKIVKEFNSVGIICDVNFVEKPIKIIKDKSNKALKK